MLIILAIVFIAIFVGFLGRTIFLETVINKIKSQHSSLIDDVLKHYPIDGFEKPCCKDCGDKLHFSSKLKP